MARPHCTAARLRMLLNYNPETGLFIRACNTKRKKRGEIVGSPSDEGYIRIWVDDRCYQAHRLAWLYMTGEWPSGLLDHINGIPGDNRWTNLRLATNEQNQGNSKLHSHNTSGMRGVSWNAAAKLWVARIGAGGGVVRRLGYFRDKNKAQMAYETAAREKWGEFYRH